MYNDKYCDICNKQGVIRSKKWNKYLCYKHYEQYRKYGSCIDNRGKCTKQQNPNKGQGRRINKKKTYQDMSKEELIKELEFRDELKSYFNEYKEQITFDYKHYRCCY